MFRRDALVEPPFVLQKADAIAQRSFAVLPIAA